MARSRYPVGRLVAGRLIKSRGPNTRGETSPETVWARSGDPCPLALIAVPSGAFCDGPGTGKTGVGRIEPALAPLPDPVDERPPESGADDDRDEGRAESAVGATNSAPMLSAPLV